MNVFYYISTINRDTLDLEILVCLKKKIKKWTWTNKKKRSLGSTAVEFAVNSGTPSRTAAQGRLAAALELTPARSCVSPGLGGELERAASCLLILVRGSFICRVLARSLSALLSFGLPWSASLLGEVEDFARRPVTTLRCFFFFFFPPCPVSHSKSEPRWFWWHRLHFFKKLFGSSHLLIWFRAAVT